MFVPLRIPIDTHTSAHSRVLLLLLLLLVVVVVAVEHRATTTWFLRRNVWIYTDTAAGQRMSEVCLRQMKFLPILFMAFVVVRIYIGKKKTAVQNN